jgi:hypothetical protein
MGQFDISANNEMEFGSRMAASPFLTHFSGLFLTYCQLPAAGPKPTVMVTFQIEGNTR